MRITHRLVANTVIRNIHFNLDRMHQVQNMLSTGKVLHKPSDDPIKVSRVMGYNSALDQNQQYRRNIDSARSWLEVTEGALQGVNEVLQRARELAIAGASGTMPETARQALAKEVDELTNVLVQLGNSSYEGRYLFAGFQTSTVPLVRDKSLLGLGEPVSVVYHGDRGRISWEVAPSVTIKGNVDGQDLFFDSGLLETMDRLVQGLETGDAGAVQSALGGLDSAIDYVLDKRAALGAIVNGLNVLNHHLETENLSFTELRSRLEDIDFAETIMNFSVLEHLYRASIATGAKIIQPSLLDYLR